MNRLAAPLSLAALGLALGCRPIPAELQLTEAQPQPPAKVFVERQPERREPSGSFAFVSADIAALYSCWFRGPYEYMFDNYSGGAGLEVHGRRYGMLMGGIRGILYYGDLNNCAGELSGVPTQSYTDLRPLEALAGVPATLPAPDLEFSAVNPEFIAYARRNLLPHPEQTIEGVPAQLAYDRVFARFFRVMTASLMMLLETGDLDGETQRYLQDTAVGIDGIEWLENNYAGRVPEYPQSHDWTTLTAPMAAGFWLRRRADGSFAAAWHGLREVLERYDADWLAQQQARHPNAAAALAQLRDPLD